MCQSFPTRQHTSIVHGRARTPECFTISSWRSLEIFSGVSGSEAPSIRVVLECGAILREADFEMPTWEELADGARPNQPENPEDEPTDSTHAWRDATLKLEKFWPILSEPEQAQMRSHVF